MMVPTPAEPGPGTKDMQMGYIGNHDDPYTWGRSERALKASLSEWAFAKLLVLRGKVQDRRIAHHIPTPDPDGL